MLDNYRSAVHPGPSSAHFVMEEPAVLDALGDVRGLRTLDLGCGEAAIGRRLLDAGCRGHFGIDASARIIDAARDALDGTAGDEPRTSWPVDDYLAAGPRLLDWLGDR